MKSYQFGNYCGNFHAWHPFLLTARRLALVNVAEQPEDVGSIHRFRQSFSKAAGREARRGFCHHGTSLLRCWRDRGTSSLMGVIYHGSSKFVETTWRSIAVQTPGVSRIIHGTRFCKVDRCANPGTSDRLISWLTGRPRKNRDEFINATVRVVASYFFQIFHS